MRGVQLREGHEESGGVPSDTQARRDSVIEPLQNSRRRLQRSLNVAPQKGLETPRPIPAGVLTGVGAVEFATVSCPGLLRNGMTCLAATSCAGVRTLTTRRADRRRLLALLAFGLAILGVATATTHAESVTNPSTSCTRWSPPSDLCKNSQRLPAKVHCRMITCASGIRRP